MVLTDESKSEQRLLAVEGRGLFFRYGSKHQKAILNDVDIVVERGVIYGLLGPSGCGKTTLLRCIIGRLKPDHGAVKVYGKHPGERGFCIPGRGVGYMPQEIALYPEITIEETLRYFGSLYLMKPLHLTERIAFLVNFLEMPKKSTLIRNLSGGEKRRVSFAAALIHQPPLLILDEPTVGVDPLLRYSIWEHLKNMAKTNHMTIMITTHYVEEARQADTVGLMRDGHLLAEMNPERLIQQHGAQNLEAVFWKLCRRESAGLQEVQNHSTTRAPFEEDSNGTLATDREIWIRHKEFLRIQQDTEAFNRDCEDDTDNLSHTHGTSLLHGEEIGLTEIYKSPSCFRNVKESQARMTTLISKGFIRLKRNIPYACFQIIVPVMQVIIFCLCIGREPFHLPLAIVNLETEKFDSYSQTFLNTLSNHTFKQESYSNLSLAIDSVKNGDTWGAMYIGPRFSSALMDRLLEGSNVDNATIDASEIKLHLDMTNQQIAMTIFAGILKGFQAFADDILKLTYQNPRLAEPPIVLESPVYGKMDPNFTEFIAPGMILGITYIMSVGLTAMSIIIEKKEGLLDRSWVAGVSAFEVIFSIIFILFITMVIQITLVLIFTFLVFDLPVLGPVFWVIVCVTLAGTCGMAYGLFISSICNDENVAMMIAMGSFFPNLLLSGIIWPLEAMDYYLRYISYCLPLTLLAETLRSVMTRGWCITEHNIWIGILIGAAWTIVPILITVLLFKIKK